jgi:CubicO group peptidase (beta-lactamase class C family)
MKNYFYYFVGFICLFVSNLDAQNLNDKQLSVEFDRLLTNELKEAKTGVTVLVARKGQIIYKKGLGIGNLEYNLPMQSEMVFRLGSITKQFTAVAILQLVEQGKLSLSDKLAKFIVDYPNGSAITIEHLLTHTSGVHNYSAMLEFEGNFKKKDFKPLEMIDFFKNKPLDFTPGTDWKYSNSGYFLLGYLIEQVSGKKYADYIRDHIFKPVGMNNSYYGDDISIIKNRVGTYRESEKGIENDAYISMTSPYSAGALMATVEDLFKWNQAIHSYKLVKKELLQNAFQPYQLPSGQKAYYGYGWIMDDLQGSPTIEHGGGINGALTNALYLPKEDVFVAVFSNCTCKSPQEISYRLAAWTIGKPFTEYPDLNEKTLQTYVGNYENPKGELRTVLLEGKQLYWQVNGGLKVDIKAYAPDKFYIVESFSRFSFKRDNAGNIVSIVFPPDVYEWKKTDKKVIAQTKLTLPESTLAKYVGEYELAPNLRVTVTQQQNRLFAQATGRDNYEVFAESESKFFLDIADVKLEFVADESHSFNKIRLYQGGQVREGKRVK